MSDQRIEFGKRRPVRLPERLPDREPAPKRSRHVALLMFGAMAVGGTAYFVMERRNCQPASPAAPGLAAPASPQGGCSSRDSLYTGHGGGSHFYGGNSTGGGSAGGSDASSGGSASRGGFGSFAHAFGFGGS